MPLGDFAIGIVENGQAPSALAMKTQTRECNTLLGIIRHFFLVEAVTPRLPISVWLLCVTRCGIGPLLDVW